jgi:hypothetical protein
MSCTKKQKEKLMKQTLLLLASLLALTACESGSSTSSKTVSKTCTYNGEPVDCSLLESPGRTTPVALSAEIQTRINLTENEIEILENAEDVDSEIKNGKVYNCKAMTQAGLNYGYIVEDEQLQLIYEGKVMNTYTREGATSNSPIGKWVLRIDEEKETTIVSLVITETTLKVQTQCHFN